MDLPHSSLQRQPFCLCPEFASDDAAEACRTHTISVFGIPTGSRTNRPSPRLKRVLFFTETSSAAPRRGRPFDCLVNESAVVKGAAKGAGCAVLLPHRPKCN